MKFVFAALLSIVTMGTPASAQDGPEVADHWRALARIDGRAALALIREYHPGAQPVLHDTVFLENLDRAQRHLEERLAQVTNYDGYNAVMEGLAADFRDGHIWSQSLAKPRSRTWTGMVVVREAGSWVIASQMPAPGKKADLVGARIVSCDGMDADAWAKSRIGMFQADPGIEARLIVGILVADRPEQPVSQTAGALCLSGAPSRARRMTGFEAHSCLAAYAESGPPAFGPVADRQLSGSEPTRVVVAKLAWQSFRE